MGAAGVHFWVLASVFLSSLFRSLGSELCSPSQVPFDDALESWNLFAVDSLVAEFLCNHRMGNEILSLTGSRSTSHFWTARSWKRHCRPTLMPRNSPHSAHRRMVLRDTAKNRATSEVVKRGAIISFVPFMLARRALLGLPAWFLGPFAAATVVSPG